jgi:hypothetical protein
MPAKDIYHDCVKNALLKDHWIITHDPLTLKWGRREMYVDLGAEKLLAAQKEGRHIAVEVKSFIGPSPINDLRDALGQYIWYADILARLEPNRILYLAIRKATFTNLFEEEPIGNILLENQRLRLIVFEPKKEVIIKWVP